jgi:hypothetical protein
MWQTVLVCEKQGKPSACTFAICTYFIEAEAWFSFIYDRNIPTLLNFRKHSTDKSYVNRKQ